MFRDFGLPCERGCQRSGSTDSPDIKFHDPDFPLHIEGKRTSRGMALAKAFDQARGDAGSRVPVVCHRQDGGEWMAHLRLSDFLELTLLTNASGLPRDPDFEL